MARFSWLVGVLALPCSVAVGSSESLPLRVSTLETPTSLAVDWSYRLGDDLGWAHPDLDDRGWQQVEVPSSESNPGPSGFAWFRLRVDVGKVLQHVEDRSDLRLGATIGKVDSAYELFAGGLRLGGIGELPPSARLDYDRHGVYPIPSRAIDSDGQLVLALRVWKSTLTHGGIGPESGPFLIGRIEDLVRREIEAERPIVMLAGLFLAVGFFHLELFRRRPALRGYLWFGLLSSGFAFYSVLRSQWKYQFSDNFGLLKELEYGIVFVLPAIFIELVWPLLDLQIGRAWRVWQGVCISLALVTCMTPGLGLNLALLPVWQAGLLSHIAIGAILICRQAWWQGHPEARIVAVGTLGAGVLVAHDVSINLGFYVGPRLTSYGFAFLLTTLAASLAYQFLQTHEELEELHRSLSEKITQRTEELSRLNVELSVLTRVDPLTGIANRRYFEESYVSEWRRAARRKTWLSLIMVDVDCFKQFNDSLGHPAGDECLKEISEVLVRVAGRAGEVVARWGGEEFSILLPGSGPETAKQVGSRFLRQVERLAKPHPDNSASSVVTISAGVASVRPTPAWTRAELIEHADSALYEAKENGRNRLEAIVLAADSTDEVRS